MIDKKFIYKSKMIDKNIIKKNNQIFDTSDKLDKEARFQKKNREIKLIESNLRKEIDQDLKKLDDPFYSFSFLRDLKYFIKL